jgi:hypothetical protein
MVRRLKRSLVGGGGVSGGGDKTVNGEKEMFGDRRGGGVTSGANGEPGEGYLADLESLAVDEKEKGRRSGRRFNFF